MEPVDELTRQRIREWQLRRLEIKDQMASQPERVLELSRVLDEMEEEHERILEEATPAPEEPEAQADGLDFRLSLSARNAQDLRKLLEMALHELDGALAADAQAQGEGKRVYPGGMSGSLGAYAFELESNDPQP